MAPYRVSVVVTISRIAEGVCPAAHGIAVIVPVSGIPQGICPATDCIAIAVSARCVLQRIRATSCLRKAIEWYNDKNNK
ncbi:hypothetical protein FBQ90_10555 [Betaproteobacteria bacterium PRO5]|nr:hypothetical protein [Betaproteobacteria bacterium PRO5]